MSASSEDYGLLELLAEEGMIVMGGCVRGLTRLVGWLAVVSWQ